MRRAKDLSVLETIELVDHLWDRERGMPINVYKLVYHLNDGEIPNEAAFSLVQVLDEIIQCWPIDKSFEVPVFEYLHNCDFDKSTKDRIERWRICRLYVLNLASRINPDQRDNWDPGQFTIDEPGLNDLLQESLKSASSYRAYYEAARTMIGLYTGLIKHKTLGAYTPVKELFNTLNFEKSDTYETFLDEDLDRPTKGLDLTPIQESRLARQIRWSHRPGIQRSMLQFLYNSTENELTHDAITIMEGLADSIVRAPLAIALSQYLLSCTQDDSTRKRLEVSQRLRLFRLGLASHISGAKPPPEDSWNDAAQFKIGEVTVNNLVKQVVGPSGDLRNAFIAVRTKIGVLSGLIRHKTLGSPIPAEEFYFPERFEKTEAYEEFLNAEKFSLDDPVVVDDL